MECKRVIKKLVDHFCIANKKHLFYFVLIAILFFTNGSKEPSLYIIVMYNGSTTF